MAETSGRRARVWITVLDALIIACACAAVVILLGGRTRLRILDVRITLRSPVNFWLFGGALAAVRLFAARRMPILPLLPRGTGWPTLADDERRRLAEPDPITRRVAWYALAACAGSIVWVIPHLIHIRYVPDAGDPIFSAWRLAAVAHQLATDPRHLWNGNIFYPLPLTLTYSDSTFLEAVLGAPFILAGADPLIVMNGLMVLSFPARGLTFFFLAWRMTGDPQAALVAALAGAWSPFYASHYSQLELQWTAFVPLALLFGMRALAAPGWKTGAAFGAAVAAQCLACMYVGVMLVSFLVPFGAMLAIAWRVRPSRRVAAAAAGAAIVTLPIVGALSASYLKSREVHGDRSLAEVSDGSASAREYADAHARLITYRWRWNTFHHTERELFQGAMPVILGAVAIVPPVTPGVMAAVAAGAAAFDWSLGLKGLTYDDLYRRFAAYRGMRVPARFSALVGAALAILAAYGARRVFRRRRTTASRGLACALLCAAVLVDLRMDIGLQPYLPGIPTIYAQVEPSMVLAEMPDGHPADYMYFSTRHWARLLDGYSGFFPDLRELNRARAAFPSPEGVAALRRLGATHLTYNCAFEKANRRDADCARVFDALAANPSLELVATERWMGSDVRLYRYR